MFKLQVELVVLQPVVKELIMAMEQFQGQHCRVVALLTMVETEEMQIATQSVGVLRATAVVEAVAQEVLKVMDLEVDTDLLDTAIHLLEPVEAV